MTDIKDALSNGNKAFARQMQLNPPNGGKVLANLG